MGRRTWPGSVLHWERRVVCYGPGFTSLSSYLLIIEREQEVRMNQ